MIAIAAGLEVKDSESTDQRANGVLSSCAPASVLIDRFVPGKSGLRPTRVVIGATERRSDEGTKGKGTRPHDARGNVAEHGEASQRPGSPPEGEIRTTTGTEGELRHFDNASKFVPTKGGDGGTPPLHLWLRRTLDSAGVAKVGRAIKRVNEDGQREHGHAATLRNVTADAGVRANLKTVLVCVDEDDATLKPTRDLFDRAHCTTAIMMTGERAVGVGVAPAARTTQRGQVVSNVNGAKPRRYPPSAMTSQGVAHDSAMDDTFQRQQWLRENGLGETEAKHDPVEQRMDAIRVLGAGAFRALVRGKTRG